MLDECSISNHLMCLVCMYTGRSLNKVQNARVLQYYNNIIKDVEDFKQFLLNDVSCRPNLQIDILDHIDIPPTCDQTLSYEHSVIDVSAVIKEEADSNDGDDLFLKENFNDTENDKTSSTTRKTRTQINPSAEDGIEQGYIALRPTSNKPPNAPNNPDINDPLDTSIDNNIKDDDIIYTEKYTTNSCHPCSNTSNITNNFINKYGASRIENKTCVSSKETLGMLRTTLISDLLATSNVKRATSNIATKQIDGNEDFSSNQHRLSIQLQENEKSSEVTRNVKLRTAGSIIKMDLDMDIHLSDEDEYNDILNGSDNQSQIRRGHEELKIQTRNKGQKVKTTESSESHAVPGRRTKDFCLFCKCDVFNFARHILRNHEMEFEVRKILSYPKKSRTRKYLFTLLRKKGNYVAHGTKYFKPMKRSNKSINDYLPCEKCLGFYSRRHLWRHIKTCEPSSDTSKSQVNAQNFMLRNLNVDRKLKNYVFPKMRPDHISLEAKKDSLICAYGAQYIRKCRDKHFINVASRKMRELAKLLLELKKIKPSIQNLTDCLRSQHYDIIVTATKYLCSFDDKRDRYESPTYEKNIKISLKQCCNIAFMTSNCAKRRADIKKLITIIQENWKYDVSNRICTDIAYLANDLKILNIHLYNTAKTASTKLTSSESADVRAYNTMLETIFCRLILLNTVQPEDLQRLSLNTYQEFNNESEVFDEFDSSVSNVEKILVNGFKHLVLKFESGQNVPIFISDDIRRDIDLLISVRHNHIADDNILLFANPECDIPFCGTKVLDKYVKLCKVNNLEDITTTKLRKPIATFTQILNMKRLDIEKLENVIAGALSVHKEDYKLSNENPATKISKYLLILTKLPKRKPADDICKLNTDLLLTDEGKDSDNDILFMFDLSIEQHKEISVPNITVDTRDITRVHDDINVVETTAKKKRTLIPWTTQQKQIVLNYFSKHLKLMRPPKRHECEELRSQHPDILKNKDWLKIKVFIQNTYTKNKRLETYEN